MDSSAAPSSGPSKCPRCTLSSTRMEMPTGFQLLSAAIPDCSDLCYHISSEVDLRLKLPQLHMSHALSHSQMSSSVMSYQNKRASLIPNIVLSSRDRGVRQVVVSSPVPVLPITLVL